MIEYALAPLDILATAVVLMTELNTSLLFDIAVTDAVDASTFMPMGWAGVWASLPFAMWLFLAVEGVPLSAE